MIRAGVLDLCAHRHLHCGIGLALARLLIVHPSCLDTVDCVKSMVYAIVETGGQQLRMEPGRFYDVPCMTCLMPGTKVVLCRVLMVRNQSEIGVGRPWVGGALVRARVMHTLKAEKQVVLRRKAKKKSRRKQGHRRRFTRLLVDSIETHGQQLQVPA